jgi:hypothetical protein
MFTYFTDIKLGFYSFTTVKIVNIFSFMAVKIGKTRKLQATKPDSKSIIPKSSCKVQGIKISNN